MVLQGLSQFLLRAFGIAVQECSFAFYVRDVGKVSKGGGGTTVSFINNSAKKKRLVACFNVQPYLRAVFHDFLTCRQRSFKTSARL
jgi:hypothetical protein